MLRFFPTVANALNEVYKFGINLNTTAVKYIKKYIHQEILATQKCTFANIIFIYLSLTNWYVTENILHCQKIVWKWQFLSRLSTHAYL